MANWGLLRNGKNRNFKEDQRRQCIIGGTSSNADQYLGTSSLSQSLCQ